MEYPLVDARTFASLKKPFNFVYLSSEGASTRPGFPFSSCGVTKGRTEQLLLELSKQDDYNALRVYSARPGIVDDSGVDFTQSCRSSPGTSLTLFPLMSSLTLPGPLPRSLVIPLQSLGDVLVMLAVGDGKPLPPGNGVSGENRTLSNFVLRRLALLA